MRMRCRSGICRTFIRGLSRRRSRRTSRRRNGRRWRSRPGMPGRWRGSDGAGLAAALVEYQRIEEIQGRLMSVCAACSSAQTARTRWPGSSTSQVSERVTTISSHLLFFTLELNRVDEAALEAQAGRPGAGAVPAVAARPAGVPAAPAERRGREAAAREGGDGAERLEPAVRRDGGRGCGCTVRDEALTVSAALNKLSGPGPDGAGRCGGGDRRRCSRTISGCSG